MSKPNSPNIETKQLLTINDILKKNIGEALSKEIGEKDKKTKTMTTTVDESAYKQALEQEGLDYEVSLKYQEFDEKYAREMDLALLDEGAKALKDNSELTRVQLSATYGKHEYHGRVVREIKLPGKDVEDGDNRLRKSVLPVFSFTKYTEGEEDHAKKLSEAASEYAKILTE